MMVKSGVPCSTVPVTRSPTRPANSSKMDWRPASRTMAAMTLLAFWAAMRLTSLGVTSRSSNSLYSSISRPVSSSTTMVGSPTGTSSYT